MMGAFECNMVDWQPFKRLAVGFQRGVPFRVYSPAPTLHQLDQAVEFCLGEAAEGRPLLIHCAHGHGRSATVMAACFLENSMAGTIDEAIAVMKVGVTSE